VRHFSNLVFDQRIVSASIRNTCAEAGVELVSLGVLRDFENIGSVDATSWDDSDAIPGGGN
jgi:hypothetical protein